MENGETQHPASSCRWPVLVRSGPQVKPGNDRSVAPARQKRAAQSVSPFPIPTFHSAFRILHSAFCILHSAFSIPILHSVFFIAPMTASRISRSAVRGRTPARRSSFSRHGTRRCMSSKPRRRRRRRDVDDLGVEPVWRSDAFGEVDEPGDEGAVHDGVDVVLENPGRPSRWAMLAIAPVLRSSTTRTWSPRSSGCSRGGNRRYRHRR